MFGLFRKPSQAERDRSAAIKDVIREIMALGEDATLSVSEIQCGDVSCPGTETVILVMRPGSRTLAYKVMAPLLEIDRDAVERALAEPRD